jgi:hypothetical protein
MSFHAATERQAGSTAARDDGDDGDDPPPGDTTIGCGDGPPHATKAAASSAAHALARADGERLRPGMVRRM